MNCAICQNLVIRVLDLGRMPLANGYAAPQRREPLDVHWCPKCDFYQLGHTVEPDVLFTDYAYASSKAGQQFQFEALAITCDHRIPRLQTIVDIGGNDGALLAEFGGGINVDPYAPANATQCRREPWGSKVAATLPEADLILATNVWAHLPDLHDAVQGVAQCLSPDGWFVVQAPWHRDLWLYHLYDTIYHEHRYYWGLKAMRRLLQQHWLDVHDVEYLPNVHGGTLRYWIRHGNDNIADSVRRYEDIERLSAIEDPTHLPWHYNLWRERERARWAQFKEPVLALGAAAKATMYWAMTETAHHVVRVFDDSPAKQGHLVPGTQLTIEPFERFPADTQLPVMAMAWNAATALKARVRGLGYGGTVETP